MNKLVRNKYFVKLNDYIELLDDDVFIHCYIVGKSSKAALIGKKSNYWNLKKIDLNKYYVFSTESWCSFKGHHDKNIEYVVHHTIRIKEIID